MDPTIQDFYKSICANDKYYVISSIQLESVPVYTNYIFNRSNQKYVIYYYEYSRYDKDQFGKTIRTYRPRKLTIFNIPKWFLKFLNINFSPYFSNL